MGVNVVKLKDIVDVLNGYAFKSSKYVSSGYRVMRITNVQKGTLVDDDPKYYEQSNDLDRYELRVGDILISLTGNVGRVGFVEESILPAYLNQRVGCLRIKSDEVCKEYLFHWLNNDSFEDNCIRNSNGIAQLNMSTEWLKDVEIQLPSLQEQKKIAKILDKADEIRTKKKLANDKLDEFLKSTFISMFGEPVRNEQKHPKQALCSLCNKITDGTHDTPPRYDSGVMIITGKNIRPFKIDYSQLDYVTEADHKIIYERCNPEYGDVLYTNIGVNLGTAVMNNIHEEFSMKNVALLKNKREVLNSRFLEHILNFNTTKSEIIRISSLGGAQKFLSLQQIRNFEIIVPPIEDQNKFAQIVEHVEAQKQKNELVIEQMNNLFNSLSQRAFKGDLKYAKTSPKCKY